jgi:Fe-S-cluster containining protein
MIRDSLDAIYAAIPPVSGCRKGCSDCCGPIPLGTIEADRIKHFVRPAARHAAIPSAEAIVSTPANACGGCAYATVSGCAIYNDRPFICRLFGAVADVVDLTCPHGARAEQPLDRDQADALGMRYMEFIHSGAQL